jgi:large subunit ribosomal protein L5
MSFKEQYNSVILPQVQKALGIENPMEAPKIEKIVLNMGIGSYVARLKDFESQNDLSLSLAKSFGYNSKRYLQF